jgi:hypothetical protein
LRRERAARCAAAAGAGGITLLLSWDTAGRSHGWSSARARACARDLTLAARRCAGGVARTHGV